MLINAACYPADNVLFQHRYFFDFILFVFSHQQDSFGECLNRMMHNKCHWDYKSFMTPQANKSVKFLHTAPSGIRTKRFLQLLEAFQYSAVLQIFLHYSCEIQMCSQLQCIVQSKQENGHKCGKRSTTNTGNYYVTHTMCTWVNPLTTHTHNGLTL